jgi:hypothetical protein
MDELNQQEPQPQQPKTPRQLWIAALLSLAVSAGVIYLGFLALPSLAPEHQAFWSGLIGSFVGSAVAFGGAAWLWRLERHILVEERVSDRAEVRRQEQQRSDQRTLRDCLAVVGNLQALNYHMINEGQFATSRDKFLMRIRFDEAVSLTYDEDLRSELEFMSRLIDDADALDYILTAEYSRLRTVHQWLASVIGLKDDQKLSDARPKNYQSLVTGLEQYEEYMEEQSAMIAEYEEEERRKAAAQEKTPEPEPES